MDSRQVLHRSGNVVTLLATFFCVFIVRYSALSVRACTKRKSSLPDVVPLHYQRNTLRELKKMQVAR
jgi:hypothetical protein